MFNIRGILNRKSDQSKSPESRTSDDGPDSDASSAEGFLCPSCLKAFPSPDLLQTHYESHHPEEGGATSHPCPACKMKMGSEAELHSHFARHHSDKKDGFEIEVMSLQVKALEEGKALLQDELAAVRLQSSELLKENCRVREERDGLELKAATLAGELAHLKAEFDETKTKKSSAESALRMAEEKIKKLEVEIQQRPEADDVSLLQQELVSVQKMMDRLTLQREGEKAELQEQCDALRDTSDRLLAEKTEWENRYRACPKKEEIDSLQEKISKMSEEVSRLQSEKENAEAECKRLRASLEKFGNYEELRAAAAEKDRELRDALQSASNKDALILKLEEEVRSSKRSVEEMKAGREKLFSKIEEGEGASVAILQLKEENARLQEQFLHQQTLYGKTAHDNELKMEELRSALHKASYELQISKERCKELESEAEEARSRISELRLQKDESSRELNQQIAGLTASQSADRARLLTLEEELEAERKEAARATLLAENLRADLEKEKKRAERLELEKRELEKRSSALPAVRAELLEREKKLTEALQELQRKEGELETLKGELQDRDSRLESVESTKADFCAKISALSEDLMQSRLSESELKDRLRTTEQLKSDLQGKCSSLEEEIKGMRISVTGLQNEKNSLLSQLEEERRKQEEGARGLDSLRGQLEEGARALEGEKERASQALRDLALSKEMYLKAKVEWQKEKEKLEKDHQKKLSELEEELQVQSFKWKEQVEAVEALNQSLEEKERELEEGRRTWQSLEGRLKGRLSVLEENSRTLGEDLAQEQRRRKDLEEKADELQGLRLELEAKLENALDERRGLLERCLRSEGECERLQAGASETRRRYEDCVAALQELGRENQTLQVENMKHVTRKWAEDAEVTHCTACGKLFTVTIRKHHCRNCGSIFCNECSARTATVAASKKPVRVCDVCFDEVTK
ncbi:early endosome antigen 1-like [Uloborus diversus]|uniref:early endosome antigen 1-like n=1 Tax=Uloborus diversus TaxID=327109 RepID=UPI002409AE87|nr:early endosome antigen 1-like [Uloborus diversus]